MLVINRASQVGAAQFIDQLLFDLEDEVATRPHESLSEKWSAW
jgi:hypothetical protein